MSKVECECGDKIGFRDLERQLAEVQGKLDAVREKLRIVPQHIAHGAHRPNPRRPCFRCLIEEIISA